MGALWAHLCRERLTPFVDVDQCQHGKHPIGVLGKSAVAHLGKPPQALERQERMLYFGTGLALGGIDLFVALAQWLVAVGAFVGEVACFGGYFFEYLLLPGIGAVAIQAALLAVKCKLDSCWLSCTLAAVTLAL